MKNIYGVLAVLFLGSLTGCASWNTWVPQKQVQSDSIRLVFREEAVADCHFAGDVVGSAGHWYNSWLIGNEYLTQGAMNDARNKALALGADTIFIPRLSLIFKTSVTILGQAFTCSKSK